MTTPGIEHGPFGKMADGREVTAYTLTNRHGMAARLAAFGAMLTELHVPDNRGVSGDVVLGFNQLDNYLRGHPYFGSTTGRVANRIAGGAFTLEGKHYALAKNNGPNHLHGGIQGLDKLLWQSAASSSPRGPSVQFTCVSPDGEEGYPGNLNLTVSFTLTDANELIIDYLATTDQITPINLTNHAYFNLADGGRSSITGHVLEIFADHFTPVDDTSIPTGEILAVTGTPMSFLKPTPIGERIHELKGEPGGYDHNYVLNKSRAGALELAARVMDPGSGRVMEVLTTEPGIQLYTGNYLDGSLQGKGGARYAKRHGFCLETQHFPDAVHHPNFPSILLRPDQMYRQTTIYRFRTASSMKAPAGG